LSRWKKRSPLNILGCHTRGTNHKLRKDSGISDFTFHQLRHTASTIISSQSSLATAKTVLGYADIKTTLQYTDPGLDEQRKSVKKLGKYFEAVVPN
jgi:integrase